MKNKKIVFGGIFQRPEYAFGWFWPFVIPIVTYLFSMFIPLIRAVKIDPNLEYNSTFLELVLIPAIITIIVSIIIGFMYSKKFIAINKFPDWLDSFSFITKLILILSIVYSFCLFMVPRTTTFLDGNPVDITFRFLPVLLNVGTIPISYIEMKQKKHNKHNKSKNKLKLVKIQNKKNSYSKTNRKYRKRLKNKN